MSKRVEEVSDGNFNDAVLGADRPVLVDFWAEWCGPCRALGPTIDALAESWAGRAQVVKLDVDANPLTTERYGVRAIPTLILFKHGEEVDRLLGAVSKTEIARKVDHYLGNSGN